MMKKPELKAFKSEADEFIKVSPDFINGVLKNFGVKKSVIIRYLNELGENLEEIRRGKVIGKTPEELTSEVQTIKMRRKYLVDILNMRNGDEKVILFPR